MLLLTNPSSKASDTYKQFPEAERITFTRKLTQDHIIFINTHIWAYLTRNHKILEIKGIFFTNLFYTLEFEADDENYF